MKLRHLLALSTIAAMMPYVLVLCLGLMVLILIVFGYATALAIDALVTLSPNDPLIPKAVRWLMTARNVAANCSRICFCSGGGKTEMMRLMVSTASSVCSVENTMWPVSAACRAVRGCSSRCR